MGYTTNGPIGLKLSRILITAAVALCSCGSGHQTRSSAELAFRDQYPVADINHSLTLEPEAGSNAPDKWGDLVTLTIRNDSSSRIGFTPDFGVRGLYFDPLAGEWKVLENRVQFGNLDRILGPDGSDIPSISVVDFRPSNPTPPVAAHVIRIFVQGNLLDSELNVVGEAGAYFDVELDPQQ